MKIEISKKTMTVWIIGTLIFGIQMLLMWNIQKSGRPLPGWIYSPTLSSYALIPALCLCAAGFYENKNKKWSALIAAAVPAIIPTTAILGFFVCIKTTQLIVKNF